MATHKQPYSHGLNRTTYDHNSSNTEEIPRSSDDSSSSEKLDSFRSGGYKVITPDPNKRARLQTARQKDDILYNEAVTKRAQQMPIVNVCGAVGGSSPIESARIKQDNRLKSATIRKKLAEYDRKMTEKKNEQQESDTKKKLQRDKAEKLDKYNSAIVLKSQNHMRQKRIATLDNQTETQQSILPESNNISTGGEARLTGSSVSNLWTKIHSDKTDVKIRKNLEFEKRKNESRAQAEELEKYNIEIAKRNTTKMRSARLRYFQNNNSDTETRRDKPNDSNSYMSESPKSNQKAKDKEQLIMLFNKKAEELNLLQLALERLSSEDSD